MDSGNRFGSLVLLERTTKKGHDWLWLCRCDCGSTSQVTAGNLRSGNTRSCGCRRTRVRKESKTIHGRSRQRIYWIWTGMLARCHNSASPAYGNYGARGIVVCDSWREFANFYRDMGEPLPGQTIDRINNDGPYSPENCRWASRSTQSRNTRANTVVTIHGVSKCIADWADDLGVPAARLSARLRLGWPAEDLLLPPWPKARRLARSRAIRAASALG